MKVLVRVEATGEDSSNTGWEEVEVEVNEDNVRRALYGALVIAGQPMAEKLGLSQDHQLDVMMRSFAGVMGRINEVLLKRIKDSLKGKDE